MGKRRLAGKAAAPDKSRKRSNWVLWAVAGAVVVIFGGALAYYILNDANAVATTGRPAPDFTLKLFDGKSVALSELKGKPVLVNFWAST